MTVTGNTTIKAVYTAIKYTVTFDASEADDGTGVPAPAEYDYGTLLSDIVPASVPTKTGHTGVWKINGTTAITAGMTVTDNITIKAVYTPNKYTITFTAPGADASSLIPDPVVAEYGDDLYEITNATAIPKKAGSDGVWLIDGTTAITSPYPIDKNITVTAVYTPRTYVNINYNFNGTEGTVKGNSGESLKFKIIPDKIQKATYDNDLMNPYAWLTYNNSWSERGNSDAGRVDSGMVVTDYVIKQDEVEVWSKKKHTVSYKVGSTTGKFYLADGEAIQDIYYGYLSEILGDYKGFLDSNGEAFTVESTVSADTSITAYKYTVTLQYADGTVETYYFGEGESFNSKYGSMPTPDSDAGYYALSWKSSSGTVVADTVITDNLILEPLQMSIDFSLAFYDSDGTTLLNTPSNCIVTYNARILDYAPGSMVSYWTVNGVAINDTTTVADVFTGSNYTINIVAVY